MHTCTLFVAMLLLCMRFLLAPTNAHVTKAKIDRLFQKGFGKYDNSSNIQIYNKVVNDCREVTKPGVYDLKINKKKTIKVRCETNFLKGGWLIIQRRGENKQDFYMPWQSYADGFGFINREYWLGLDNIFTILDRQKHELMILMENFEGLTSYALYDNFQLGSKEENFKLKRVGTYVGEAGDSLQYHLNQPFSTHDRQHSKKYNCADLYHGAWWYKECYTSNLNGKYPNWEEWHKRCFRCILWNTFIWDRPLKFSQMMVRKSFKEDWD